MTTASRPPAIGPYRSRPPARVPCWAPSWAPSWALPMVASLVTLAGRAGLAVAAASSNTSGAYQNTAWTGSS